MIEAWLVVVVIAALQAAGFCGNAFPARWAGLRDWRPVGPENGDIAPGEFASRRR